jgi:Cu+-exporting ATPase
MAMIPALQFTNWQWASLTLAAPVVVWGGLPFHRAAWANLRHGAATMDTLVSMGTLAAFLWSLYALFFGTAGMPGMKHPFELTIQRLAGDANIYLEVAAGVTVFILSGRYFEARCGHCWNWAPRMWASSVTAASSGSPSSSWPSGTDSWSGRARRSPRTA